MISSKRRLNIPCFLSGSSNHANVILKVEKWELGPLPIPNSLPHPLGQKQGKWATMWCLSTSFKVKCMGYLLAQIVLLSTLIYISYSAPCWDTWVLWREQKSIQSNRKQLYPSCKKPCFKLFQWFLSFYGNSDRLKIRWLEWKSV